MSRPDEAFSWDGDDDPTLTPGAVEQDEPVTRSAPGDAPDEAAVAAASTGANAAPPEETVDPDLAVDTGAHDADDDSPGRAGDLALVTLGVIAGVYLVWTAGWVSSAMRMRDAIVGTPDAMFLASMVLAILAPAIWFGAAWYLTAGRRTWMRIVALLGGIVVLVPWPFVMVGVIGQ